MGLSVGICWIKRDSLTILIAWAMNFSATAHHVGLISRIRNDSSNCIRIFKLVKASI